MDERYRVTIYVAAPGTPMLGGGTSAAGHVYYTVDDGRESISYGFAPKEHGATTGPGKVYDSDAGDYQNPFYQRTLEISKDQYEKLKEFGDAPDKHGFNTEYHGLNNSCIDFTWGALNHAGLHRTNALFMQDKDFQGGLKPLTNIEYIRSIRAPFPDSALNTEHYNKMPERALFQRIISDEQLPRGDRDMLDSIRKGVAGIDERHGRSYDATSERISVGLLATAKESGLERVDHVVLGNAPSDGSAQRLFVVQGELNDPAHVRASMAAEEAARTPVEQSFAKVEQISKAQQERASLAPQELAMEQTRAPLQMG
ncbi:XVIPCD domain-containing protein [Stenotrophomonas maltophilia]|uniref:XVIPCD domain-containing protein n=1 Tax=Stenotrophomonas maltophilia TaxID=40324 RepID=UPI0005187545|nr:XVIPCD domain-containing protein [Stenotrophomonas maltophilia]